MFVKTSRSFNPHDKLVREYYKLEPHFNGMVKNGRRNLRHEVRSYSRRSDMQGRFYVGAGGHSPPPQMLASPPPQYFGSNSKNTHS